MWVFRTVAVAIGFLFGGLLLELGLRLKLAIESDDPQAQLRRAFESRPPAPQRDCSVGPGATLGQMIRPTSVPDLVYRLRPGLDTCFYGARVRTNRDGLRSPFTYEVPKPPGVFRILFLGDSQTFGHGVAYEHTFIEGLRVALQRTTKRRVEVINTGVSGYNTAQEAAYLRHLGMRYQPDCIAILFIGNDLGLPQFLLKPRGGSLGKRSLLWDKLVAFAPHGAAADRLRMVVGGLDSYVGDDMLERVPRALRHLVGYAGYKRALARIATTAKDVPVVNFADYRPLPVAWRHAELVDYNLQLGIRYPPFHFPSEKPNWLSATDGHMNVGGHRKLVKRMLRGFYQVGACLPPPRPARTR